MFRSFSFVVLALSASALAAPQSAESQCNNDHGIQCCESTYQSDSVEGRTILSAINRRDVDDGMMLAAGCGGGITNTGGGSTCSNIPVCCENNYFGLIGLGCTPIPVFL